MKYCRKSYSSFQYMSSERTHGGKKDVPTPRDPIATSPNLAAEHNLQFHQHGDISYCELPSEADRLKHTQKVQQCHRCFFHRLHAFDFKVS